MAQSSITVLTDAIVYILPMPTLYSLQLPAIQRVILMVLFGLGAVVVVAGCMRTYWIYYVEYETYDVTWEGFNLWIWAAVEVNLGVICGCVPTLKPLFFRHAATTGKSTGQSSNSRTKGTKGSQLSRTLPSTQGRHYGGGFEGNGDYIDLESLEERQRK